jgi:hypothetical protein
VPEPVFEEVPITQVTAVDLLFVIDNSNSMAQEQAALQEQVEVLFSVLINPGMTEAVALGADLHVGVATTDMGTGSYTIQTCSNPTSGDNGVLQNRDQGVISGCRPTYSALDCDRAECPWLSHSAERPDDGTDPTDPPIWEDFGCIATLGSGGCGFEQPLESSLAALTVQTEPGRPNEGFLREGALLTVVYVTDEDDCSSGNAEMFNPQNSDMGCLCDRCVAHEDELYPISRYHDAFVELAADRVVVAAITGVPIDGSWNPGDPIEELRELPRLDPENPGHLLASCDTSMGIAFLPVRIAELIDSFGDDGVLASICREDWSDALLAIAHAIQHHLARGCVDVPNGVDPATACHLFEIADDGCEIEVPHVSADPRGWSVEQGVEACPRGQLRIAGAPVGPDGFVFECKSAAVVINGDGAP